MFNPCVRRQTSVNSPTHLGLSGLTAIRADLCPCDFEVGTTMTTTTTRSTTTHQTALGVCLHVQRSAEPRWLPPRSPLFIAQVR